MASTDQRPTATIYQFPKRDRFAERRELAEARAIADIGSYAACDSWYHENALRDADKTRLS
ncbi:hypothetical protein Sa4125_03250 [Aureimonas sp. SA4125]|uniref:DUF2735 domain-containing protein n=1 Tax=Aureimonas sp. SA4125 TaxID=2826993 RepID=UPI001CC5BDDA|nr:DUF2735 domain-containing protein [Aureimonas sp. SA4125]BDA82783.1 hypothetical protein Sa4125_03250 [Aureimonas sp. SA4125]